MNLTTLANVKTLLGITDADSDALISQLLPRWSAAAESFLNRAADSSVARTQVFDVELGATHFQLEGFGDPDIDHQAALTTVRHDVDRVWGSSADDVEASDRYFDLETGLLSVDVRLTPGFQVLQVVYTSGMAITAADFVTKWPEIAGAVEMQVGHITQRHQELGQQSVSFDGNSVSAGADAGRLMKEVKRSLMQYRVDPSG